MARGGGASKPSPVVGNPLIISSLFPRPPFFCTTPPPPFVEIVTLREVALVERGRKRGKERSCSDRPPSSSFFSFRLRWAGLHRRGISGFGRGEGRQPRGRQADRQDVASRDDARGGAQEKKGFPRPWGGKKSGKGLRAGKLDWKWKREKNQTSPT